MLDPTSIGLYLAEILFQELVITNISAKLKENALRRQFANLITETLKETIADTPNFEAELESERFLDFLRNPITLREIKKLISARGGEPDILILCEEWSKTDPIVRGNREFLLARYLSRVSKKLWDIEELHEKLHIKDALDTNAFVRGELSQILSKINDIRDQSIFKPKSEDDIKFSTKLDVAKEQLARERPNTALDILREIENELVNKNISSYIRFRLFTLIGACEYNLGNHKDAVYHLQNALELAPNDPKALANAALAALLTEKYEEAIKLANQSIANGGDDTVAIAIRVQAIARQNDYENLDALVDEKYFGNCDYVRALAHIFQKIDDYVSAEKYYKLAISQNPSDYHSFMGLTQVILEKNFRKLTINQNIAQEANNYIDLALEIAQKGDNQILIFDALAAKSGLYLALGEHKNALDYCEMVLKECPNHKLAIHNRAVLAMMQRDYTTALIFFDKLPEDYRILFLAYPIAEALITTGQPDAALELLYKRKATRESFQTDVFIAKALLAKEQFDDAENIKKSLLANKADYEPSLAAAEIADAQGQFSEAIDILENLRARLAIDDSKREFLTIRIGLIHYFHHQFEAAASQFNLVLEQVINDIDLSRIYIRALYSDKKYADVYKALQTIPALGANLIEFLETRAWLAEYFGNLKEAHEIQKQLVNIEPGDLTKKIQLARLEFRTGERSEALRILHTLNHKDIQSPYELIQVAEMFYLFGELETALKISYRSRITGLKIPEIHLGYLSLFIKIDDQLNDFLAREKVEVDSAVLLKSEKEERWFKIIDLIEPDDGKWEFSKDSPIGKILLGHQIGEKVEFKSTPLEKIQYTISQIQSIYVRAYQESFEEFGTRFPNRNDIQKTQNTDGDINKIFLQMYQHSSFAELVYKEYARGALSISQFSSLIGRNLIDVFTSILATKNQRVFASYGTGEDQQQQKRIVDTTDSITLDITSLITINFLESSDLLKSRFKKIFISQATLDVLEQTIVERYFDLRKGKRSIGFHEGRPFVEEIPIYAIEQNLKFLTELLTFVKTKCELVEIPAELTRYLMVPDDPLQAMDKPSIATILVAKHTATPLFADDARLRAYAEKELSVFGFWSQSFFIDCNEKNLITKAQYNDICVKLLRANFHFVSTNSEMIIEVLRENSYVPNAKVSAILLSLKPDTDDIHAISIGCQVIKDVWLSGVPQRDFVTDLILRNLCEGRNKKAVIEKSLRILDQILILAAANHDQILSFVRQWYRVNPK